MRCRSENAVPFRFILYHSFRLITYNSDLLFRLLAIDTINMHNAFRLVPLCPNVYQLYPVGSTHRYEPLVLPTFSHPYQKQNTSFFAFQMFLGFPLSSTLNHTVNQGSAQT